MSEPVRLKRGAKLVKRLGRKGPVRKVVRLMRPDLEGQRHVLLEWTQTTKRKGTETLQEKVALGDAGLPEGYVPYVEDAK